jgi:hypothetical protein
MIEYALLPRRTRRFMAFQRLSVLTGLLDALEPQKHAAAEGVIVKTGVDVCD